MIVKFNNGNLIVLGVSKRSVEAMILKRMKVASFSRKYFLED
jgi:hypothetical protein